MGQDRRDIGVYIIRDGEAIGDGNLGVWHRVNFEWNPRAPRPARRCNWGMAPCVWSPKAGLIEIDLDRGRG